MSSQTTKKPSPSSSSSPMEGLLGPTVLVDAAGTRKGTAECFRDKQLVGLYFSASWCPPCQAFSPHLIDFYKTLQSKNKNLLEIVYVASDRSVEEFEGYYGKMPWLAVPGDKAGVPIKNALASTFYIQGIPALIVVDGKTGEFITATARNDVQGSTKDNCTDVIAKWMAADRIPLNEAANAIKKESSMGPFNIGSAIMAIAKNPVYIFGMLYIVKYLYRVVATWYNGLQEQGDDGAAAAAIMQEAAAAGGADPAQPDYDEQEF